MEIGNSIFFHDVVEDCLFLTLIIVLVLTALSLKLLATFHVFTRFQFHGLKHPNQRRLWHLKKKRKCDRSLRKEILFARLSWYTPLEQVNTAATDIFVAWGTRTLVIMSPQWLPGPVLLVVSCHKYFFSITHGFPHHLHLLVHFGLELETAGIHTDSAAHHVPGIGIVPWKFTWMYMYVYSNKRQLENKLHVFTM